MSPIPNTRHAFVDRQDRIEISHPLIAAALMRLGHEVLGVVGARVLFRRDAQADYKQLNRHADEVRALLERARANSNTPYIRSQARHADRRQQ